MSKLRSGRPAPVAAAAQGAVGVGARAAVLGRVEAGQGARRDDGLSAQSDDQAVWVLGGGGGVRAVVFFAWVMVVLGQFQYSLPVTSSY